jgi:iron(II)-dependent oxidoreductase
VSETAALLRRHEVMRARTAKIFGLLAPEAFDRRPISLRHPFRFYEGHLSAFSLRMLRFAGCSVAGADPALEELFSRGIDPLSQAEADGRAIRHWPERPRVWEFIERTDRLMRGAISAGADAQALHTAFEHELMHQETLLYMIHQLDPALMRTPPDAEPVTEGAETPRRWISIPGGVVRLGVAPGEIPFGWDNEFPAVTSTIAPFCLASRKTTCGDFLAFMEAGGYRREEFWSPEGWRWIRREEISSPRGWDPADGGWRYRTLFGDIPLPRLWPVQVSHAEASAFARWTGARLPTETEWQAALAAWPECGAGNTGLRSWHPLPETGRTGATPLTGNGWEWTATPFAGYPGFRPMPQYAEYSADFFDGRHFVLRGASPVTPPEIIRPSFRNWFQDRYRFAYTTFRCAKDN